MFLKSWFKSPSFYWFLLAILFSFVALNRHSKSKIYTYSSQLWADKSGYYIYLPATFIYGFDASRLPEGIALKLGEGFSIQATDHKIISKYPVGVAILQLPFFAVAHAYSILSGSETDGFAKPYQNALDLAAVFYLLLGLFYLRKFLLSRYPLGYVNLTLAVLLLGTNLFYYSFFEGGFSHVFSFCLFSALLYYTQQFKNGAQTLYQMAIIIAFIVLVRPLNILFVPLLAFGYLNIWPPLKNLKLKQWGIAVFLGICLLIPQLVYYYYVSGSALSYSYGNESFIYLFRPKILEVWFSWENGLISTNPLILFVLLGIALLSKRNRTESLSLFAVFMLCTLVYASWWAYLLGCAYGHRGFVDIYPLLSIGLAEFIWVLFRQKQNWLKGLIAFAMLACVLANIKFIYTYDTCWPVDVAVSDFEIYWHFLTSQTK